MIRLTTERVELVVIAVTMRDDYSTVAAVGLTTAAAERRLLRRLDREA